MAPFVLRGWILRKILIAVFLAALAVPAWLTAQEQKSESPQQYVVTDLGTLGGTFSVGLGINNKRLVNGNSTLPGDTQVHAFLWRNGAITDLGTLGGPNSNSNSPLNDRGEVTGFSDTATPDPLGEDFCAFGTSLICLPFLWRDGVMTPLPTLGGNNGQAFEINNRGQAAGNAENSTIDATCVPPQVPQFRPVIFEKGEAQELPILAGDADGFAVAINDRGLVVGSSGNCATPDAHAVLWQPHDEEEAQNESDRFIVTNLGSLGGTASNDPQDINNAGEVVGSSSLSDGTVHAFLWTPDMGMQDLGTLPGDTTSFGSGINSKGQVVGSSLDATGNTRAFVRRNGVLTDLNTVIPAGSSLFLFDAFGINDRGDIVGDALDLNTGETHAYLASPCHAEEADNAGCKAAPGGANLSQRPKVVLPESARRLLRRRLGHH